MSMTQRILVSLISDQTIPNILLIQDLKQKVQHHLLVSTEKMEEKGKSASIQKVTQLLELSESQVTILKVKEDDLEAICQTLKEFQQQHPKAEFWVNLTGGTKMMSLGAYKVWQNQPQSRFFYQPIGQNAYQQIEPEVQESQIQTQLTLEECFQAYSIQSQPSKQPFGSPEENQRFLEGYLKGWSDPLQQWIGDLRKCREKKSIPCPEERQPLLKELGWPPKQQLSKTEICYLTGDWWEEVVYAFVQETLGLGPKALGLGIQIQNQKVKNENVTNEIDVAWVWKNALHVIECKTRMSPSKSNTGDDEKSLLLDTLYKQQALSKDWGLTATTYLFTLDENINENHRKRSKNFGIRLVDRSRFIDPEKRQALKEEMKR